MAEKTKLTTATDGYHAITFVCTSDEDDIRREITERAKTDKELADAIAEGKRTFEGFFRMLHNETRTLAKETGCSNGKGLCFDRHNAWDMAVLYFKGKIADRSNAELSNKIKESKPKDEKPKTEKPKKEENKPSKVVPITPSIGSLFDDDFFK